MGYDSIIFDLDGTLWDATAPITEMLNAFVKQRKIQFREIGLQDVRRVTGKPQDQCMRELFAGLSYDQLQILIEDTANEESRVLAQKGGEIYFGVEAGLRELSKKLPLYIVSNCQSGYIETFLKYSGFGPLFKDFECWGNTGQPKAENIRRVIERNALRSPVYVGDAEGDQSAARKCGIPFLYVTYGFGKCTDFDAEFGGFGELVNWMQRDL